MPRIVMIANDTRIDRRIIAEAESLIDAGHDVHLMAGHQPDDPEMSLHETIGRISVERVPWGGVGPVLFPFVRFGRTCYRFLRRACDTPPTVLPQGSTEVTGQRVEASLPSGVTNADSIRKRAGVRRFFQNVLMFVARWIERGLLVIDNIGQYTARDRAILKKVIRHRPDIIHVHDLPLLRLGATAKEKLNIPLVYDAHELFPQQPRITDRQSRQFSQMERRYIYSAEKVITVNSLCAKAMEDEYAGVRVDVIQNAVDPPAGFDCQARHDLLREEYGLAQEAILLLYQGGIMSERNLENLIRGMRMVRDKRCVLILMGYGDYWPTLKDIICAERLEHRVICVPAKPQNELLFYTASADVGVIPYPYDADLNTRLVSPNKLYEFVVAGLPILSNLLPFVQEVVSEHDIGVCRDLQSPEACAAAIDEFPFERMDQFRQNLDVARSQFTWETESQKLLKLYESLQPAGMDDTTRCKSS